MDDQQMDKWMADQLRQEQEFDFHESDWDAVAGELDQRDAARKRRRRIGWFWWPLGIAASLLLGILIWQQQQITELRGQLTELSTDETPSGANNQASLSPEVGPANAVREEQSSLAPQYPVTENKTASQKTKASVIPTDKESASLSFGETKTTNSSVTESRAQSSAVDSSAESPAFLEGKKGEVTGADSPDSNRDRHRGRQKVPIAIGIEGVEGVRGNSLVVDRVDLPVEKIEVLVPPLTAKEQAFPTELSVTATKIRPRRGNTLFELDLAGGIGRPQSLDAGLVDQGNLRSSIFGLGVSVQPIQRWWIRAGISRQKIRYAANETVAANAYADYQRGVLEELYNNTPNSSIAAGNLTALEDERRYWQLELGLRYDWLQKAKWELYARGDVLARVNQKRQTNVASLDIQALDPALENEQFSSNLKDFGITGVQLGLGANYKLNSRWRVLLESTLHLNTENQAIASELVPRWDIRTGLRYRF